MWNGLLSFSWALTDAVPGDGGFGCIPGSHRAEEPLPAGAEDMVVEVPQRAGSLLVFTEALVHCTVPWTGAADRLSLLYKYSPGNSTWARNPPAPPEVLRLLTPRQRQLVEPPYVGGRAPSLS
jgi:Protein involved in biosynthesis of mitomycin antibiotics/polyketide fumonisin